MQRVHYTNKSAVAHQLFARALTTSCKDFILFTGSFSHGQNRKGRAYIQKVTCYFSSLFLENRKGRRKGTHNTRITDVSQNNNLENIFYQFIFHFLSGGPARSIPAGDNDLLQPQSTAIKLARPAINLSLENAALAFTRVRARACVIISRLCARER
jgi:hypothetical protein